MLETWGSYVRSGGRILIDRRIQNDKKDRSGRILIIKMTINYFLPLLCFIILLFLSVN